MKLRRGRYSINGFLSNGSKSMGSNISFSNSDFGSKDETFYESRPCFDSDCDEEFYSVRGDFTPSRTNTPNNQTGTPNPHRLSKSISAGPTISIGEECKSISASPTISIGEKSKSISGPTTSIAEKEIKSCSDIQKPRLADLLRLEQESIEKETMMKNSNRFRAGRLDSVDETPKRSQNRRKKGFRIVRCCIPGLEFKHVSKENRERKMPTET